MSIHELPEELLQSSLWYPKLSLGPGNGLRRDHTLCRRAIVSCMKISKQWRRIAEPLPYHTITSGQLNSAMERDKFKLARCCQMAELVHVLFANCNDSQTMVHPPNSPSLPMIMFQVGICTKLQALVLSASPYPRYVLPSRLLRDRIAPASGWPAGPNICLANLCRYCL